MKNSFQKINSLKFALCKVLILSKFQYHRRAFEHNSFHSISYHFVIFDISF